ncbi:MAG TPA: MBL fold metallo-hydrolase [Pyrinomonadaceae bacterium]|jgi:glyoxylase-like metal-dependent hydrolase (beta-lactamase superfamily II)|nr:MBL fold metallo-hydrolase [Pyrinomonadaceae bacterium]
MFIGRVFLFTLLLLSPLSAFAQTENFEMVKVADGVYAAIRKEPPGLTVNGNSVFIINERDVVVVDSTLTPGTAKEELAALRRLTDKPVKYVINTHWHDDHIMGNQVYRDAFPGVEFIAHARTREYLPTTGLSNRKMAMSPQGYPGFIAALKKSLEKNESVFGGPMDEEERAAYRGSIQIAERYMAENPKAEIILPTITIEDRLTLYMGSRTIDIRYLGRGHSSGDLVVHLPKEGIVVAGDLVMWPVPYVGNPQSHPGDWSATLERLIALRPTAIIPGHGPVLRDDSYVKQMARLFASIRQQVEAGVARGENLEQIRKSVSLSEFEKLFVGDSRMRRDIFGSYVVGAGIAAAFSDAKAVP